MWIARLAALALVATALPAPPAQAGAGTISVPLCNGGTLEIALGDGGEEVPVAPCPLKACHAGSCRKQFDRSQ